MINQTISHYRITGQLGAWSMRRRKTSLWADE